MRALPREVIVLDSEALSLAVRGDRSMAMRLDFARDNDVEVVASPMTLIEAFDTHSVEQRWDWALSRVEVPALDKDQAREARRLLAAAGLHGHRYAVDAVVAVVARRQVGQVTVFTSDTDDLERLLPPHIAVRKV
ncbi:hypothetical protein I6A60_09175 [Frankia sp. AgB1.9]|uniref:hypothetical protein n=1 Tax=unclassified Frankia TaxID=2632575 RepID=UPI001931B570|nr:MULTISPECIES: hypothetical protein [unclassified Frankia]MBL7487713.1 hypothetical protein [Frankia sp. AgW1.1]MBL7548044.1 hypothetical protein [Frankia sp. AgB1.9]MBL7624120.1 hypothetical protein [Frankia sp. AgB1.8]